MRQRSSVIVSLFAFVACVGAMTTAQAAVEWKVSDGGNGHSYEVVAAPAGITWQQARDAAVARGGNLATITCSAEDQFVYNLASQNDAAWTFHSEWGNGPWLGGFQPTGSPEPAGGWQWVTGEPWSYANWAPGTPNDDSGLEDSLHYGGIPYTLKSSQWNDISHDSLVNGYVIEFNPVPEPSSLLALLCGVGGLSGMIRRRRM